MPVNLLTNSNTAEGWVNRGDWDVDDYKHDGLTVFKRNGSWMGLNQPVKVLPYPTSYTWSALVKKEDDHSTGITIFWNMWDESGKELKNGGYNIDPQVSSVWRRVSFTLPASDFPAGTNSFDMRFEKGPDDGKYVYIAGIKIEAGSTPSPWSPNPTDPEYSSWYYGLNGKLSVPYHGTVPCNQLEQGFEVEFVAKQAASSLSFKIDDTELTYIDAVAVGDVFVFSGFSYTQNGLSIVSKTNKAYFILQPDKPNRITCNVPGTVRILGFQNLYA
jgi:hypothetical protein